MLIGVGHHPFDFNIGLMSVRSRSEGAVRGSQMARTDERLQATDAEGSDAGTIRKYGPQLQRLYHCVVKVQILKTVKLSHL